MKQIFKNLVRVGLSEDMAVNQRDEIKLMNSISIHSVVITAF
jgi:hypothetical protein